MCAVVERQRTGDKYPTDSRDSGHRSAPLYMHVRRHLRVLLNRPIVRQLFDYYKCNRFSNILICLQ